VTWENEVTGMFGLLSGFVLLQPVIHGWSRHIRGKL
jgi:hypothetical protein